MQSSERLSAHSVLQALQGAVIVSCQAAQGEPLDDANTLTRIAAAVLLGGAGGLRAEGVERVASFRALTSLPIIGIVKAYDPNGDVSITPDFKSAQRLSDAQADVIALDCTRRRLASPEPWPQRIDRIHRELARPVCADIATFDEGLAAESAGADCVATTLYGYASETQGARTVSWTLVESLAAKLKVPLIVEGHISQPGEVRRAFRLGAHAVVVGSAITRPQWITARFVAAARTPEAS